MSTLIKQNDGSFKKVAGLYVPSNSADTQPDNNESADVKGYIKDFLFTAKGYSPNEPVPSFVPQMLYNLAFAYYVQVGHQVFVHMIFDGFTVADEWNEFENGALLRQASIIPEQMGLPKAIKPGKIGTNTEYHAWPFPVYRCTSTDGSITSSFKTNEIIEGIHAEIRPDNASLSFVATEGFSLANTRFSVDYTYFTNDPIPEAN